MNFFFSDRSYWNAFRPGTVVRVARKTRVREQCDAFRAAAFTRQVDRSSGNLTDGFLIILDVCFTFSMLGRVCNICTEGLASMFG